MWRFEFRRDTAANWTAKDPILLGAEIGVEIDTNKFKLGDGVHSWSELVYFIDETGVAAQIAQAVIDGVQGPAGESAYQLAVDGGFVGTQAEWLASLVGPKGDKGDQGDQGIQGIPGTPGADGADYTGPTITVASAAPSSPAVGDVWIDTSA